MKEGWKRHKLNELADMRLGKMLDQNKNKGEFYDYLANVNVQWGEIILDNLKQMKFESSEFDRYGLNVGDIVMCEGGEPGRCSIWKGQRKVMMIQKALHRIRAKSEVNSYFLYYYLFYRGKSGYFEGYFTGSTIKHFTGESLAKVEIDIPPIQTQRKIASILSGYDDLIENNLKRIKILEEMVQQTYEEWFVRMRFPDYETAVMNEETGLPEGWEKVKLGDWINTSSGGTPSKKKEIEFYENGTIPWVRTGELKNFILIDSEIKITESGLKNSSAKLFPKGTVLLAMYGNTIGEVTYCDFPTATNQACCGFLVKNENEAYFIHQYLLKNKEQVLSFRMGAAQENISQTIIQNMELIKPDEILLMEFGQICKRFYDSIINFLYQNQRLRETRDLLLPRLMMGILEV